MGVDMQSVQSLASVTSKVQPVEFRLQSWSSEGLPGPSAKCIAHIIPLNSRSNPMKEVLLWSPREGEEKAEDHRGCGSSEVTQPGRVGEGQSPLPHLPGSDQF